MLGALHFIHVFDYGWCSGPLEKGGAPRRRPGAGEGVRTGRKVLTSNFCSSCCATTVCRVGFGFCRRFGRGFIALIRYGIL